jgi:hypothetical protein
LTHRSFPRLLVVACLAAPLALAACGGSSPRRAGSTATTKLDAPTTTLSADGMTAEEMKHMKPALLPSREIPVLANGDFDPTKINLGGTPGVTPAEQVRAQNLLRQTVEVLPEWDSTATAATDGFHSIGDGLTGDEHWIHWDWINDNDYLDPHKPEALVYHVDRSTGQRTLEAAMFILPNRFNFDNLPNVGGPLMQYHIHDNLCFTNSTTDPQVAGLTDFNGGCQAPLVKFRSNVMVHVWIRPNACGPFAALEGVGAGQVSAGQTRACDTMHGDAGL